MLDMKLLPGIYLTDPRAEELFDIGNGGYQEDQFASSSGISWMSTHSQDGDSRSLQSSERLKNDGTFLEEVEGAKCDFNSFTTYAAFEPHHGCDR
jgi:hypothetical protein